MSTSTIPAVGDSFDYQVIASTAEFWHSKGNQPGHRGTGPVFVIKPNGDRKIKGYGRECDPNADRTCALCFDQWETRTSTVTSVASFMDNSIEVYLADGTRRMVVAPHGDACF
ncbi:hypothetical protein SEA_SOOS_9 [Gordonia phage Soos]|nr:hypothetical protein SEA_SOOS_9 [Gordonia phage Soos]